jgi:hypothetical protein
MEINGGGEMKIYIDQKGTSLPMKQIHVMRMEKHGKE